MNWFDCYSALTAMRYLATAEAAEREEIARSADPGLSIDLSRIAEKLTGIAVDFNTVDGKRLCCKSSQIS